MEYDLTLGERLDVVIGERRCISNVQEITREGTLVISAPTFRSTRVPVKADDLLNMIYYRASGMFSFIAAVTRIFDEGSLSLMEVEIRSPISKYQRRDFVRFETVIPLSLVTLASPEAVKNMPVDDTLRMIYDRRFSGSARPGSTPPVEALSLDISGGGLRFACRQDFERDTLIECTLMLSEESSITADAIVVRNDINREGGARFHIGCRFVNIEERIRRRIIKYIFEEQVKRRQKSM